MRTHRRASVLILVLIVVAMLALAGATYFDLMFNQRRATYVHGSRIQATALCESGVEYLRDFLTRTPIEIEEAGNLFDNSNRLRGILVAPDEDPRFRGRFTVLAPLVATELVGGVRFGLEDESARINLNSLLVADQASPGSGRGLLMALPGMTESIADAILDWLDEDDEPREFGAERDYYSTLTPPYAPANGPLETVEQLLLVKGVAPELLLGVDSTRNTMVDPGEMDPAAMSGLDEGQGTMNRGWSAYFTIYSAEKNVQPDGTQKVDINMEDLEALHTTLSTILTAEQANFIVAYRQGGPYEGPSGAGDEDGGGPQPAGAVEIDFRQPGRVQIGTILDLIGVQTRVVLQGESQATVIEAAFPESLIEMSSYLPTLMDHVSVNPDPVIPGRININQAPRTVLLGVPGLEVAVVDEIIASRVLDVRSDRPELQHETWLLTQGIVTLEEMKSLIPFLTGGGDVYRAQIVGFFDGGGPAARVEIVLDATSDPRTLLWRDLSHLGPGYTLQTLGAGLEEPE